MGEYANIKRDDMNKFLKWLIKKDPSISVEAGGKHQIKLKYSFWNECFPIPFKHSEINRHIVKDLMKKLVQSKVCTKIEFDQNIK